MCLNDVIEEEQILPNKIESDQKVNLKMASYKNDRKRCCTFNKITIKTGLLV